MTSTKWRLCVAVKTLWQQQNNKYGKIKKTECTVAVADVFYIFNSTVVDWICFFFFVNRTIQHWKHLKVEVLGTLPCKPITLKRGQGSDNWVEIKGSKVCWKSSKSVEKRSVVKWKFKSELKSLKWSENLSNVKYSEEKWSKWHKCKWNHVMWGAVQGRGSEWVFMEKVYGSSKWWELKDWGESVSELMIKKISKNCTQYFFTWLFLPSVHVVF